MTEELLSKKGEIGARRCRGCRAWTLSCSAGLATGALTSPSLHYKRIDEAAALPSPAVVLSVRLKRYYGRLRRPPGTRPFPGANRL